MHAEYVNTFFFFSGRAISKKNETSNKSIVIINLIQKHAPSVDVRIFEKSYKNHLKMDLKFIQTSTKKLTSSELPARAAHLSTFRPLGCGQVRQKMGVLIF